MNGDSFVRDVLMFVLMSVVLLRSLLMLLEVDEMEICNCANQHGSIAIMSASEIE